MIKIIIAGSRSFDDYDLLKEKLNEYINQRKLKRDDIEIISGGARDANKLGEKYAWEKKLEKIIFKAEWNVLGKAAGYIRNREMANYGDVLFAFWDGESRGTKHMIKIMTERKKEVYICLKK